MAKLYYIINNVYKNEVGNLFIYTHTIYVFYMCVDGDVCIYIHVQRTHNIICV